MNIRNNKGINLISLTITVIILLVITGAMIFNTKNQLSMKEINALKNDIELLNSKIDDYYLKYGELPTLCNYSTKSILKESINGRANDNGATLNSEINEADGSQYMVIDLEKLDGLTLNYGYDKNGEYFTIKSRNPASIEVNDQNHPKESEIYIINTVTHQIYFPRGIFADNIMYYTF